MNEKYKKFCEEYVIDLNGRQAAIRTGYSEKRAEVTASELLARDDVRAYIVELQKDLSEHTKIKAIDVINELAKIGFANIQDYYDEGLSIKEITELEMEKTAAISSIKKTVTEFEGGTKTCIEFKLHDKISSLEKIGRHLGVFEKDNKQKDNKTTVIIKGVEPPPDDL